MNERKRRIGKLLPGIRCGALRNHLERLVLAALTLLDVGAL